MILEKKVSLAFFVKLLIKTTILMGRCILHLSFSGYIQIIAINHSDDDSALKFYFRKEIKAIFHLTFSAWLHRRDAL